MLFFKKINHIWHHQSSYTIQGSIFNLQNTTAMKKKLLLLIVATFALTLQAHQIIDLRTGAISTDSVVSVPQNNIEYVSDGFIVTYKIDNAAIHEDDIYPLTYRLEIPGFYACDSITMPSVLSGIGSYILPKGATPTLTVLSTKHIDLNYELTPSRESKNMKDTIPYSVANVPPVDPYTGFWPNNVCEILPSGMYRHQPIAKVLINPIRYNYGTKTVRAYSEIKYKITLPTGISMSDLYYEPLSMLNSNCTLAPYASNSSSLFSLEPPGSSIDATTSYILVSVPQFKETLQPFVKWKKQLGYNIIEMYDDNWTPDKIKSEASQYYNNDSTLMYMLIVGDGTVVPAYRYDSKIYEHDYLITDFNYSCLDGDKDSDPDIYIGRWPVRNVPELQTIIDKTIWYEQSSTNDVDFYKRGIHYSLFEDGCGSSPHDGIEDSRFVKTCEDVKDYLSENYNFNIDYHYTYYIDTSKYAFTTWPAQWNKLYADTFDLDLPDMLLHKNGFMWDATSSDIIESMNNGASYLLYSGHGADFAWGNAKTSFFTSSDVRQSRNYDKLPVVLSIACSTGKHDSDDCLMRTFLTHEYGGAIAAFAKTNYGYYNTHGRVATLFFNAIWPNPGLKMRGNNCNIDDHPAFMNSNETEPRLQLGSILNFIHYGFSIPSYKSLYHKQVIHCFGDPSLYFHTTVPTEINNVEITETETGVHVLVPNQEAFISFYDPINNRVERRYGTEAVYLTGISGGGKYIDITVYTPVSKPYTRFGIPYYGTVESTPKQYGLLNYRDLKNGTVEIDYCLSPQHTGSNTEIQIVEAMTGSIVSSWPIDTSIKNQKVTVAMRCEPGIMVAYMMANGTPISSIKMYISKY